MILYYVYPFSNSAFYRLHFCGHHGCGDHLDSVKSEACKRDIRAFEEKNPSAAAADAKHGSVAAIVVSLALSCVLPLLIDN